jgi:hypothetical protein
MKVQERKEDITTIMNNGATPFKAWIVDELCTTSYEIDSFI